MILGIPIPVLNRYWPPARGWRPRSSGREWWQQPLSIFHEESLDNLVTERRKALMEPAHGVFSAFRMRIIGRVAIHVGKMRELLEIAVNRSEEHTSELQSLMRISYAVFCLKKKKYTIQRH